MSKNLDPTQLERAYRLSSSVYDLVFGRVFSRGRKAAVECAEPRPGDEVLEVGVGTGLNLAYYPAGCRIVGVDMSPQMLAQARRRVERLAMAEVTLLEMDAARLGFADASFDKVIATYLVSAVPRPAEVLKEMRRVVRPGGAVVVLNHFTSPGRWHRRFEYLVGPLCRHLGWKTDLALEPLLEEVGMRPELARRLSVLGGLLDGWQLLRFRDEVEPKSRRQGSGEDAGR